LSQQYESDYRFAGILRENFAKLYCETCCKHAWLTKVGGSFPSLEFDYFHNGLEFGQHVDSGLYNPFSSTIEGIIFEIVVCVLEDVILMTFPSNKIQMRFFWRNFCLILDSNGEHRFWGRWGVVLGVIQMCS